MKLSPFSIHRDKVLGYHGTAAWLRMFVLAMWNGSSYKVGLSQLTELDEDHYAAAMAMLKHYRQRGENDPAFMALAEEIRQRLAQEAAERERAEAFDDWCKGVARSLRGSGAYRPYAVDDNYNWLQDQFAAGKTAEEAAMELAARLADDPG